MTKRVSSARLTKCNCVTSSVPSVSVTTQPMFTRVERALLATPVNSVPRQIRPLMADTGVAASAPRSRVTATAPVSAARRGADLSRALETPASLDPLLRELPPVLARPSPADGSTLGSAAPGLEKRMVSTRPSSPPAASSPSGNPQPFSKFPSSPSDAPRTADVRGPALGGAAGPRGLSSWFLSSSTRTISTSLSCS